MEIENVEVIPGTTGRAYVFVDEDGENRIVLIEGANGHVDAEYLRRNLPAIRATDCLLLQNEIPRATTAELLARLDGEPRDKRPTVVFDPAPADGAETLLGHNAIDIITPNEAEYNSLQGHLREFHGIVIRKRGLKAVLVEGPDSFSTTPPPVTPVDTTGAGDVFNGYLAALLAGRVALREAVEFAMTAASLSTESRGVQNSIPTIATVRRFLE